MSKQFLIASQSFKIQKMSTSFAAEVTVCIPLGLVQSEWSNFAYKRHIFNTSANHSLDIAVLDSCSKGHLTFMD